MSCQRFLRWGYRGHAPSWSTPSSSSPPSTPSPPPRRRHRSMLAANPTNATEADWRATLSYVFDRVADAEAVAAVRVVAALLALLIHRSVVHGLHNENQIEINAATALAAMVHRASPRVHGGRDVARQDALDRWCGCSSSPAFRGGFFVVGFGRYGCRCGSPATRATRACAPSRPRNPSTLARSSRWFRPPGTPVVEVKRGALAAPRVGLLDVLQTDAELLHARAEIKRLAEIHLCWRPRARRRAVRPLDESPRVARRLPRCLRQPSRPPLTTLTLRHAPYPASTSDLASRLAASTSVGVASTRPFTDTSSMFARVSSPVA